MIIYHGSKNIVKKPEFGKGNVNNDYGLGFYCTESLELAREWACEAEEVGYVNRYAFSYDHLRVLELTAGEYHILNWLAILLHNRRFVVSSSFSEEAKAYIIEQFLLPYQEYDVICGYRADDSYFSFAKAFISNSLSLQQLERAMVYGELGVQIVPRSKKAFEQIRFLGCEEVDGTVYYPKRKSRDEEARKAYREDRAGARIQDDIYMIDILRGEWKNNDSRLRRIILR